jgi:hypothetical protein
MAIAPTDSPAPRSPSSATLPKARGAGRKLTAAHADEDNRTVHDGASLSTSPSPSRSTTTSRSTRTITMLREREGSRQRIATISKARCRKIRSIKSCFRRTATGFERESQALDDGTQEPGISGQQATHGKRHRQHPLPHRAVRQDRSGDVRRRGGRAPSAARRFESAPFARVCDQHVLAAPCASKPRQAVACSIPRILGNCADQWLKKPALLAALSGRNIDFPARAARDDGSHRRQLAGLDEIRNLRFRDPQLPGGIGQAHPSLGRGTSRKPRFKLLDQNDPPRRPGSELLAGKDSVGQPARDGR